MKVRPLKKLLANIKVLFRDCSSSVKFKSKHFLASILILVALDKTFVKMDVSFIIY